MEHLENLLSELVKKQTVAVLECLCNNVEALEEQMRPHDKEGLVKLKAFCVKVGRLTNEFQDYSLRSTDHMLRLYKVAAAYSKTSPSLLYDRLESSKVFMQNVRFHLDWAASHAREGKLVKFQSIMDLVKNRGIWDTKADIGFREIAQDYFPNDNIFGDDDDEPTLMMCPKPLDKGRRRSHVNNLVREAQLQNNAESKKATAVLQPTKSHIQCSGAIGMVIVNRFMNFSPEEMRAAEYRDKAAIEMAADDDMDLETTTDGDVSMQHDSNAQDDQSNRLILSKSRPWLVDEEEEKEQKQAFVRPPILASRQRMSMVPERCDDEKMAHEEALEEQLLKRQRFNSPIVPTRESVFARKNVNDSAVVNTSQSAAPTRVRTSSTSSSTSTSAAQNGPYYTEDVYNNARAIFSDTINIDSQKSVIEDDDPTMPIHPKPAKKFEVYVDQTMDTDDNDVQEVEVISKPAGVTTAKASSTATHHHQQQSLGARRPFAALTEEMSPIEQREEKPMVPSVPLTIAAPSTAAPTNIANTAASDAASATARMTAFRQFGAPAPMALPVGDEETLAGIRFGEAVKCRNRDIVTSTPAHPDKGQVISFVDFFEKNEGAGGNGDGSSDSDTGDETMETEEEPKHAATQPLRNANTRQNNVADESIGISRIGFATSTPAETFGRKADLSDFFASRPVDATLKLTKEDDDDDCVATGFMLKRRQSLGGAKVRQMAKTIPGMEANKENVTKAAAPAAAAPKKMSYSDKSMEFALDKMNIDSEENLLDELDDMNKTGLCRPVEAITGVVNPWNVEVRKKIMDNNVKPTYLRTFMTDSPTVSRNRDIVLGGQRYKLHDVLGEGGYAKVYRCTTDDGDVMAMKYEIPSCAFEAYICDQLHRRLSSSPSPQAPLALKSVMSIKDAFIYDNASLLVNEYMPHGTLLDVANSYRDPSWQPIVVLAIHMARVLKEIHDVGIIHGDAKPDNFMLIRRLPESATVDELLSVPLVKLIDWGRAIDMQAMPGQLFTGKAGTANFDCPAMLAGEPWSFHTDYFGFISSIYVLVLSKYSSFVEADGAYRMTDPLKRRFAAKALIEKISHRHLNIQDPKRMPGWDDTIEELTTFLRANFKSNEWSSAASRFNEHMTARR